ncbi:MAG: hypothetical protein RLY23_329 [Actinomycetota bacterium]
MEKPRASQREEWESLISDLEARRGLVLQMGGEQRVLAQHAKGRLTARERFEMLLDEDSFCEIGAFVGSIQRGALPVAPADAFVMGHGTINGYAVLVGAEDATVMGGTIGVGTLAKRLRLFDLAKRTGLPLVLLLDGAGMRTRHPNDRTLFIPDDLTALAAVKGSSPIIVGVMGTCAGHGALTATFADHLVMVDGAALFGAGPPVVSAVTGVDISSGELGGVQVHSRGVRESDTSNKSSSDVDKYLGIVDFVASDDQGAIAEIRKRFISLALQDDRIDDSSSAAMNSGQRGLLEKRPKRFEPNIQEIIPADLVTPWDVLSLIEEIADDDSLEILSSVGSVVTARLSFFGYQFVVIANQPAWFDGRLDSAGAYAAADALAGALDTNTPVLLLADSPGLAVGVEAEASGVLSAAQVLLSAQRRFTGSLIHVTLRRSYGVISALMGLAPFGGQICTIALAGARVGEFPAETASEAVQNSGDSLAVLAHTEFGGALDGAEQLLYDMVLAPNELIPAIRSALRLLPEV